MLERDVASKFNTIFYAYGLLAPINNSVGGWPDRLIHLPNSRIVAVEIKSCQLLKSGLCRLAEFRPDQAAWLAKWQKNYGLCFLFIGLNNIYGRFEGYGIIKVDHWRTWTTLPNALLPYNYFTLVTNSNEVIIKWFVDYTELSYAGWVRST